jgi:hypothetical protein
MDDDRQRGQIPPEAGGEILLWVLAREAGSALVSAAPALAENCRKRYAVETRSAFLNRSLGWTE